MSINRCGASSRKSKRDTPLVIKGRLTTPEDYGRDELVGRGLIPTPEEYMYPGLWERGYLPQPTDSDFSNINNFITEQCAASYPGAKPCPLPLMNPVSTAIAVDFDTPPDENYFPSVVGLEGCTSVVVSVPNAFF